MGRRTPLQKIETLTARLATVSVERDRAIAQAIADGVSWPEIAAALGVSTQAAHKRYRWLRIDPDSGATWHEPPLPT
jgi:FixJ family two-component response regulator